MRKAQYSSFMKQNEGFTLSMAFMDTLPVLFFSISIFTIARRFQSILFLIGALTVILAGALKVSWKFVLALKDADIPFLNRQMRFLMPAGFLLIIMGLIINHQKWSFHSVIIHILSFPSLLFFLLGLTGICFMVYYAVHFNGHDAHANWIEQGTNILAQLCIMLGILL